MDDYLTPEQARAGDNVVGSLILLLTLPWWGGAWLYLIQELTK